jgi:hypothetical protein
MLPRSWHSVLGAISLGLSALVLLTCQPAFGQTRICLQNDRIPDVAGTGKRSQAVGDYIVLFYNAATHQTAWYDYRPPNDQPREIPRNASLFPIVYMKEKMAVHVCGLHFGDTLTVSTNPVGVLEGGADIRGATANTAPALQSTTDALSGSGTTGGSVQAGSLGFGSPNAIGSGSLAVNGFTPGVYGGKNSDGTASSTYTDATINVSPEEFAIAERAYRKNAGAVCSTIRGLMTGYPGQDSAKKSGEACLASDGYDANEDDVPCAGGGFRGLPGSIQYLLDESYCLLKDIQQDSPNKQNFAAFDEYQARVQALVGELNGLNSTLSGDALGARAIALQQNYATIRGILEAVYTTIKADEELCQYPPAACSSLKITNCSTTPVVNPDGSDETPTCKCPTGKCAEKKKCESLPAVTGADTISCHYWENQTFKEFIKRFTRDKEQNEAEDIKPQEIFEELGALQGRLRTLTKRTGEIFKAMNQWYEDSNVEDTDLLTPVAGNALMRINIIVQRTFVPFTFAGSASSASPATTASPSTSGAVSGGGGGGSQTGGGGSQGNAGGAGSGTAGQGASGGGGAQGSGNSGSGSTTTPAHTVETVLVEVHRRANFNIVAGAMVIRVPTKSFSLQSQVATTSKGSGSSTVFPASCNGGSPVNIAGATSSSTSAPYYCATVTQTSDWQVAGMVGVAWFPSGRDYFPRGTSGSLHIHNMIPAVLVATSVTSLGNSFIGPDFEPVNGLDLYAGFASAHQTGLPSTQSLSTVFLPVGSAAPTLSTVTHVKLGLTFGVGFDFSVFTQIFGKTASASLP